MKTSFTLLAVCLLGIARVATAQVNYEVSGSTAYVTWSPNASGAIVIASTYNGHPVTSIGNHAFYYRSGLTSVTIPNSVTSIGYSAFRGCTGLTSVTIPNSVTSIGGDAFTESTNLASVTIPDSVTSIGIHAFSNCTSLTSVTIPNGVTNIGIHAFRGCGSLTSVTIGNSVTDIGELAFSRCPSLTNLSVDAANPVYSSLDGVLFNKTQTTLITYPGGRAGGYVVPDSVTSIGQSAFYEATNLTSVTIPDSVTSIGSEAFSRCGSLTSVTIGNSVTGIGNGAFSRCTNLKSVIIGNSVTDIGNSAFFECLSLTSVTIPNSVTVIGIRAFYYCTNLTNVLFGNSVEDIYGRAFEGCTKLANLSFLGDSPDPGDGEDGDDRAFDNVGLGATVYYYCGTTGWGTNYAGLPTVMLCPPQFAPGSAGVKPGGFGFTLTCLTNQTIVVEASTNLANWQPIWTNSLPGASADFVDPEWLQHSNRFYRARSD